MKNIMNHRRDTAMNDENTTTECKRQVLASRNSETSWFGREMF